jgi:hypothetical protein
LALSFLGYQELDAGWVLFVAPLFVPDLSATGYLAGGRTGAAIYNFVHTLTGPLVLIAYSIFTANLWLHPTG